MRRRTALPTAICLAASVLLAAPALSSPAQAAASPRPATGWLARAAGLTRVETPVTPAVPVPGVTESYVQLRDPLPASDGPVPAACDWIGYLRLRSSAGPANPEDADAVMTLMPGDEAGAALYVNQARLVVQEAAAQGKHVEVWILSRRSNCLVDTTGLAAAAAAHNWQVAINHYYLVVAAGLPIPGNAVVVPFYRHLDVGGLAAGVQNNGQPEQVSTALTHFILTGVPGPG